MNITYDQRLASEANIMKNMHSYIINFKDSYNDHNFDKVHKIFSFEILCPIHFESSMVTEI